MTVDRDTLRAEVASAMFLQDNGGAGDFSIHMSEETEDAIVYLDLADAAINVMARRMSEVAYSRFADRENADDPDRSLHYASVEICDAILSYSTDPQDKA